MKKAFTLSEVLITLVIIGIIAAITVPMLNSSIENQHFKVAYKKAYSDFVRATMMGVAFREFPERITKYDYNTTIEEWNCIKKNLIAVKYCENNNLFDCWVDDDRLYTEPNYYTLGFIDNSGRAWALYSVVENIYLVDTNGDKKPNKFGKDRWAFTMADARGNRICSEGTSANQVDCANPQMPAKIIPFVDKDYTKKDDELCKHPPCYYKSWLIK